MTETLRTTPLHDEHTRLGAKMVPFAGYRMPVQYASGARAEHRAVREAVGLFDVSHMGEFHLEGPQALELLRRVAANDAGSLDVGQAQYSVLLTDQGTVIDDLLVYRTGEERYLLVVNAATRKGDWDWIGSHAGGLDLELEDRSDETALLALQGPGAQEVLQPLTDVELDDVAFYRFAHGQVAGVPALVSRTGYTGEDGFEIYHAAERAPEVWRALLEAGESAGIEPAGLAARDILRLEVGYPLYGNDLDREHTALEAGLGWVVKLDRHDFVGREALLRQKDEGVPRRLTGIRLTERGFPRPGYAVVHDGREVGQVTSGTVSPSLETGIALAYLPAELASPGTSVAVRVRDRDVEGVTQRPPFYEDGSLRR
ncbi:MAG: glycine cleavage system aminomethyltransferase GcvT [bacterium]